MKILEGELRNLRGSGQVQTQPRPDEKEKTLLIGGQGSFNNKEDAERWLSNQLWYYNGPTSVEVYCKGAFSGIIFAKFHSKGERDLALRTLKEAAKEDTSKKVWVKADQVLQERAARSLAFGLKFALHNSWGFETESLWADAEGRTAKVWVGNEDVMTVVVEDKSMKIEYAPGWKEWLTDPAYPDFKKMVEEWSTKLSNAAASNKGMGKGAKKGGKPGDSQE